MSVLKPEIAADDVNAGVGMQYTHTHHPRPIAIDSTKTRRSDFK